MNVLEQLIDAVGEIPAAIVSAGLDRLADTIGTLDHLGEPADDGPTA